MRNYGKVDLKQPEIVMQLRDLGWSVTSLANLGHGVPDILIGVDGHNVLVELKSKGGELTPAEDRWQMEWRGQVFTCYSVEEVIECVRGKVYGC
jgi:hypothetical protein